MTTCLGKRCSFGLPSVPFVNCCQFMYLVISRLVLRAGYGTWLCQFLSIAYMFASLTFRATSYITLADIQRKFFLVHHIEIKIR